MNDEPPQSYTAFTGHRLLAHGPLEEVVLCAKERLRADASASILVFSDLTGKQMDFDLSGSEKEVLRKLQVYLLPEGKTANAGPGRPKLGVVAREISLLPRHWEWLSTQSGGASATLRRLVEEAKKDSSGKERVKQAQERAHKFMSAIAGDLPLFEEALRALYAKDAKKFKSCLADWPADIKEHARRMAAPVFA